MQKFLFLPDNFLQKVLTRRNYYAMVNLGNYIKKVGEL